MSCNALLDEQALGALKGDACLGVHIRDAVDELQGPVRIRGAATRPVVSDSSLSVDPRKSVDANVRAQHVDPTVDNWQLTRIGCNGDIRTGTPRLCVWNVQGARVCPAAQVRGIARVKLAHRRAC